VATTVKSCDSISSPSLGDLVVARITVETTVEVSRTTGPHACRTPFLVGSHSDFSRRVVHDTVFRSNETARTHSFLCHVSLRLLLFEATIETR
jgi:hypothetical protein